MPHRTIRIHTARGNSNRAGPGQRGRFAAAHTDKLLYRRTIYHINRTVEVDGITVKWPIGVMGVVQDVFFGLA